MLELEIMRSRLQFCHGFTSQEIREYGSAFLKFCDPETLRLAPKRLRMVLEYMGYPIFPTIEVTIASLEDPLSQEDFVAVMINYRSEWTCRCRRTFDRASKNGVLSSEDIPRVLEENLEMLVDGDCLIDALEDQDIYVEFCDIGSLFDRDISLIPDEPISIDINQFLLLIETIRQKDRFTSAMLSEIREVFVRFARTADGKKVVLSIQQNMRKILRALGFHKVDLNALRTILEQCNPLGRNHFYFFELVKVVSRYQMHLLAKQGSAFSWLSKNGRLELEKLKSCLASGGAYWEGDEIISNVVMNVLGEDVPIAEKYGLTFNYYAKIDSGIREEMREVLAGNHGFLSSQWARLAAIFSKYDVNRDGNIASDDLANILRDLFHYTPSAQVSDHVIALVEMDHKPALNLNQFLDLMRIYYGKIEEEIFEKERKALARSNYTPSEIADFRAVFQGFDVDQSGSLDFGELVEVISMVLRDITPDLKKQLHEFFTLYDEDGNKQADFAEFILLMQRLMDDNFGNIKESLGKIFRSNLIPEKAEEKMAQSAFEKLQILAIDTRQVAIMHAQAASALRGIDGVEALVRRDKYMVGMRSRFVSALRSRVENIREKKRKEKIPRTTAGFPIKEGAKVAPRRHKSQIVKTQTPPVRAEAKIELMRAKTLDSDEILKDDIKESKKMDLEASLSTLASDEILRDDEKKKSDEKMDLATGDLDAESDEKTLSVRSEDNYDDENEQVSRAEVGIIVSDLIPTTTDESKTGQHDFDVLEEYAVSVYDNADDEYTKDHEDEDTDYAAQQEAALILYDLLCRSSQNKNSDDEKNAALFYGILDESAVSVYDEADHGADLSMVEDPVEFPEMMLKQVMGT